MALRGNIAVIGAGKIGQTLIRGLLDRKIVAPRQIVATTAHAASADAVRRAFRIRTAATNAAAVRGAQTVLVAVKPPVAREVLSQVRTALAPRACVISTVAAVTTRAMEEALGGKVPVVRTMPNTPCLIGEGMTGIAPGRHAGPEHVERAAAIFRALGRAVVVDERHMDAVTGLSASGPAFMYIVLESLAEGGVKVGLPRELATELAAQTMLGSARMVLQTGHHPALLKDAVTTPAGCTIDGIMTLEEGGLRVTLLKAIVEATRRAGELAGEK
jgi:pyrroline-5-carboxylate reductase